MTNRDLFYCKKCCWEGTLMQIIFKSSGKKCGCCGSRAYKLIDKPFVPAIDRRLLKKKKKQKIAKPIIKRTTIIGGLWIGALPNQDPMKRPRVASMARKHEMTYNET